MGLRDVAEVDTRGGDSDQDLALARDRYRRVRIDQRDEAAGLVGAAGGLDVSLWFCIAC